MGQTRDKYPDGVTPSNAELRHRANLSEEQLTSMIRYERVQVMQVHTLTHPN
jgi:hypothetical protein